MKKTLLILLLFFFNYSISQTVGDFIDAVDIEELTLTLNEFSGEISTVVNGNTVTILNRESNTNNNLAADYLVQKFNAIDGLTVTDDVYSPGVNGGRNVYATQLGKTNPDDIYIICAHYDSIANYCADDNVSGTAAVLEIARILSQYDFDNTIIYALWDQEEIGLLGSNNFAETASTNGDNILAVLNMDMMGYENDGDNEFDIDVRNFANSIAMKDDIINVLNTYSVSNDINLTANVVNPGTFQSDHSSFWDEGYSAVLFGEAWSTGDRTPHWHLPTDRVATIDLDYYFDMVKLAIAYTATKANVVRVLANNEFDKDAFNIYPNPTVSVLNIESKITAPLDLEFYDINGKLIKTKKLENQNQQVDVSNFFSGIYFIKISSADAEHTFKFVKE